MRRTGRLVLIFGLVCGSVPLLPAQEGRRGGRGNIREFLGLGPPPDPAAAERGSKLYASNCAFCHGEKARGAEGPDLVRSVLVLHDEKGELIGPVISAGRTDRGMPAFPALTGEQRNDIAQFLHMQVELAANRGSYKRLNIVTGDARKGEQYFNGAGRCNTCHSVTGDLAHIATRIPQPDQLQSRFVWPGVPRERKVTVTPASGPAVSGTLKRMDDFQVSLWDSSGSYRSFPREGVKVEVEDKLSGHRRLLEQYTDADIHDVTAYLVTLK